jgi:NAD(P)-dependent dehydrogenase (short-subunit alcohol dehydrogenase family)
MARALRSRARHHGAVTDLDGRTFLVTGANTGIGRATARELARRGGRVVLAGRSEAKVRAATGEIARDTGNDSLDFLELDLADLDAVRSAAESFLARDEPLHVLVNNAGVAGQRGRTAQGFELAFGTNHLGHFLFTLLLLSRLRESGGARVVCVSSDSHYRPKGIDFDVLRRPTRTVTGMDEYGVSKLCNVLFAQELARRVPEPELITAAVHPGVIASDIWRRVPWPVRPIMTRFMGSTEEGAATSIHCATSAALEGRSGRFWVDCEEKAPNRVATPGLARELWERSEEWTGAPIVR